MWVIYWAKKISVCCPSARFTGLFLLLWVLCHIAHSLVAVKTAKMAQMDGWPNFSQNRVMLVLLAVSMSTVTYLTCCGHWGTGFDCPLKKGSVNVLSGCIGVFPALYVKYPSFACGVFIAIAKSDRMRDFYVSLRHVSPMRKLTCRLALKDLCKAYLLSFRRSGDAGGYGDD